jgi:hypothetical protein
MEHLQALGTDIQDAIPASMRIYAPILEANAQAIQSINKETFSYGSNPRQMLDVYHPPQDVKAGGVSSAPILIFFYGGGFVRGDRVLPTFKSGLVYANLGHFFASLGYITIIPDYRLVPEAKFPSGGEDVLAALEWTDGRFGGQGHDIYLMGHSAGGVHIATFALAEVFAPQRSAFIGPGGGLKGLIFVSVPFSFRAAHEYRNGTLQAYFGPNIEDNSPMGLLKLLAMSGTTLPTPMLVFSCALDPADEIIEPTRKFSELCQTLAGNAGDSDRFKMAVIEGHNHISPVLSVGTAIKKEEAWALEVHEWIRSRLAKRK